MNYLGTTEQNRIKRKDEPASNWTSLNQPRGFMLLEAALVLALIAVLIGPILNLQKATTAGDQQNELKAEQALVSQALEGFVMVHGRLPCPATLIGHPTTSDYPAIEDRNNQQCKAVSGPLPTGSLGLPHHLAITWTLSVATLERAGAPSQFSLFRDHIFEFVSLQTLREIIFQPETPGNGIDHSALPAIHLCLKQEDLPAPAPDEPGCQTLPMHSPSILLVAHRHAQPQQSSANSGRHQQFLIQPSRPDPDLYWMDFNQFIWLRMTAGWGI